MSISFGVAHAYQGTMGIVKTGAIAFVMAGIVLASGWLIPAMVIHALTDVSGGVLSFRVRRKQPVTVLQTAHIVR